jgi:phosphoribosylanthranilate isomerase
MAPLLVKICGVCRLEDARHAVEAGADWIGLNLFTGRRRINLDEAAKLLSDFQDPSRVVALLDASRADFDGLRAELARRNVQRLQLYGSIDPELLQTLCEGGVQVILPWPAETESDLIQLARFLEACGPSPPAYLLFDSRDPDKPGGTGRPADWDLIARAAERGCTGHWPPILLAGGLTPDNVAEAVQSIAPVGVDVCSGVESEPGVKDRRKVASFIEAARRASVDNKP